jgi:hypothetical protein
MIPYRGSTPRRKMSEAARCSNSVGKVDVYWLNDRFNSRQRNCKFFQSSCKTRCRVSNLLRGYFNKVHSQGQCLEMNLPRWVIDQVYVVQYTGLFEMIVGVLTTSHTQYTWDSSM